VKKEKVIMMKKEGTSQRTIEVETMIQRVELTLE